MAPSSIVASCDRTLNRCDHGAVHARGTTRAGPTVPSLAFATSDDDTRTHAMAISASPARLRPLHVVGKPAIVKPSSLSA